MVWVAENRLTFSVQSLIEQIVAAGQLSRREHMRLTSAILADHQLTDEERRHISRVLDYVQIGRLKLVD
jgi:DICT domain-containing protein